MCDEGAPAVWAGEREGERAQSQSNRVQDGVFRSLSICVTLPLTEVDDLCTAGFSLSTWRMSPGGATYNKSVLPAAGKSSCQAIPGLLLMDNVSSLNHSRSQGENQG